MDSEGETQDVSGRTGPRGRRSRYQSIRCGKSNRDLTRCLCESLCAPSGFCDLSHTLSAGWAWERGFKHCYVVLCYRSRAWREQQISWGLSEPLHVFISLRLRSGLYAKCS